MKTIKKHLGVNLVLVLGSGLKLDLGFKTQNVEWVADFDLKVTLIIENVLILWFTLRYMTWLIEHTAQFGLEMY